MPGGQNMKTAVYIWIDKSIPQLKRALPLPVTIWEQDIQAWAPLRVSAVKMPPAVKPYDKPNVIGCVDPESDWADEFWYRIEESGGTPVSAMLHCDQLGIFYVEWK
jgi:hypothetical protein